MVKRIFICLFLAHAFFCRAQTPDSYVSAGLLRGSLGLNSGFMLQHPCTNLYLGGLAEYFPDPVISLRGDCRWYLDARGETPVLADNLIILFGGYFHQAIGRHDFSIGIQPGLGFTRPLASGEYSLNSRRAIPYLSAGLSYSLYFSRFCHFFLNASWLNASYRGNEAGRMRLSEIEVSGGLGFQLDLARKK